MIIASKVGCSHPVMLPYYQGDVNYGGCYTKRYACQDNTCGFNTDEEPPMREKKRLKER